MRGLVIFVCAALLASFAVAQCPWDDGTLSLYSTLFGAQPDGSDITVTAGQRVLLDQSTQRIGTLLILGELVIDNIDLTLTADQIIVQGASGRLTAGNATSGCAITANVDIVLTNDYSKTDTDFGTKVLGARTSGELLFFSSYRAPAWTQLAATAAAGASQITVLKQGGVLDWTVGDQLVLASTDYDPDYVDEVTITGVVSSDSTTVTLSVTPALEYMHFGEIANGVDERGEVALLNRAITIRGDNATNYPDEFGCHIMCMMTVGECSFSGVEITQCGQRGQLGRYPLHLHLMDDATGRQLTEDNVVHHAFQRCYVVHGTHNATLTNNVCYDSFGHAFFIEDGIESFNTFEYNLAIRIRSRSSSNGGLLASDSQPSGFWITNPDNSFRYNHVAGASRAFWYAMPVNPTGPSFTPDVCPQHIQVREFSYNVGHGCDQALFLDDGNTASGFTASYNYRPSEEPCNTSSTALWSTFSYFTGYKNGRAIWTRGQGVLIENCLLADNAIGLTHASNGIGERTVGCTLIGETANVGNPRTTFEILAGRSLANPWNQDGLVFPIRGVEYYDGPRSFEDGYCARFSSSVYHDGGCISVLRFNRFSMTPTSQSMGLRVASDQTKPVHFPDDFGDGAMSVAVVDVDGTITGGVGATVTRRTQFLSYEGCGDNPAWNATICPGPSRLSRLRIENVEMDTACNGDAENTAAACRAVVSRIKNSHQNDTYGSKPSFMLMRDDNDASQRLIGTPIGDGNACCTVAPTTDATEPQISASSTIVSNTTINVWYTYAPPLEANIYVNYMDDDSTVTIAACYPPLTSFQLRSLPYYTIPWNGQPTPIAVQVDTMDELNVRAPGSAYFKDGDIYYFRVGSDWDEQAFVTVVPEDNTEYNDCGFAERAGYSSAADALEWMGMILF